MSKNLERKVKKLKEELQTEKDAQQLLMNTVIKYVDKQDYKSLRKFCERYRK